MRPVPVQRQTSLKKNTDRKNRQNESVRSWEPINPPTKIEEVLHHPNITKFGSTSQHKKLGTGAWSTIAGFVLTVVNYEAAVQALKKRYGKDIAIQRAHVNNLLNMLPVYSDQDIPRLRKLYSLNLPPEQERLR